MGEMVETVCTPSLQPKKVSACNNAIAIRSRSLRFTGICNMLSISLMVLSGRVSASLSALATMRLASCVGVWHAAQNRSNRIPIMINLVFMLAKVAK